MLMDEIIAENGDQVGAVLTKGKGFGKKRVFFCFLCNKDVPDLKHFEEEH